MTLLVCLKLVQKFKLNTEEIYFSVTKDAAKLKGTSAKLEEG